MFRHILVPTDLTDRSFVALEIAVKMASREGTRVTLLHVVEVIEDSDCDEFESFYQKLEHRARRRMQEMIGRYDCEQVTISREITFGKRVGGIVKFAREEDIDLIVLSSHKIEPGDVAQGWGTISYRVGILSHCPVLLVK